LSRNHVGEEVTYYKYTDQEFDGNIGLYNYNARLYDPGIAIFISPDSIIPKWYDPKTHNRFSYCINNPLIYIDPSGHAFFAPGIAIGIGAGGVGGFISGMQNGGILSGIAGGVIGGLVGGLIGSFAPQASGTVASSAVGGFLGAIGGLFGGAVGRGATEAIDAIENDKDNPIGRGFAVAFDFEFSQSLSDTLTGGIAGTFGGMTAATTAGVRGSQIAVALTTANIELPSNLLLGIINYSISDAEEELNPDPDHAGKSIGGSGGGFEGHEQMGL
jgi:RHS repeat-associated protein